ncbi:alpha/beta hydrolase-fold protein [Gaetbulibacter sp. PBL-D1]|uniref:alpha/beta hydrolase-fold protein n=1 Tax=Gaetbulibacter sp. PBL-D1 TaxID=3422594 RepID=UPI003D2EDCE1
MKRTITFIIVLFLSHSTVAQEYSGTSKTHSIASKVFEDAREIRVFLPYSYTASQEQTYPTIYLFDAQFDAMFDMTSGITDYLAQIGELTEFIIVGIKTKHRPREFTPKSIDERTVSDWENTEIGKAYLLENYLLQEVFPLVESSYRIKPLRLAIGHSLGGTFVLNSILSHPEMFKGIIAISPNVSYDYEQLVHRFDAYFKTHDTLNKFIFVSAGTVGNMENRFAASLKKLDDVISYHKPKGLKYNYKVFQDENHSTSPLPTISQGLMAFGDLWVMSETQKQNYLNDDKQSFLSHLKAFYSDLSNWAGFEVLPTVDEANMFGYDCLNKDPKAALKVFDWALNLYPNDANLHDSKAEAYEKNGDLKNAKLYYKKALNVLEKNKATLHPEDYAFYLETFTEHLKKLD